MKKSTLGLAVIAAFPMFSSVQVLAAEDSAQAIEKIQVTGSRIKRADMETASPVTIIGAESSAARTCTLENIGNAAITAKPRDDFFMNKPYLLEIYLNW